MKKLIVIILLLLAFTSVEASCCEPAWQPDIPLLKSRTRSVLAANGITAPAFVFALGDSLENYYVFKESKHEYIQYVINNTPGEEVVAAFREKKSNEMMKLLCEIYSYSKDVDFITYVSYISLNKPTNPTAFLYYNEDGRFSGICIDYRSSYSFVYRKKNTMSERFIIAAMNFSDLCRKALREKQ